MGLDGFWRGVLQDFSRHGVWNEMEDICAFHVAAHPSHPKDM